MITKRITVPLLCLLPLLAVMALLGALHTPTINAAPDDIQTVTTLANDGAGSLRQAIADATAGDTVEFSVSGTIVLATELVVDKNLTINGGNVITVSGNNTTRVFKVTNGDVIFNNLTIANGKDQSTDCTLGGSYYDSCGAGILIQNSGIAVTVTNSIIVSNSATYGGGIFNFGELMVVNSTLSGNSAIVYGGGIFNDNISIINNSTLSGNSVGTYGGGIYTGSGNPVTVNNSTISGNSASFGGGIANVSGIIMVSNSTVSDNSSDHGGGILNLYGTATIIYSTLSSNSASHAGGSINNNGTATVQSSTISDNAADSGGGIFSTEGVITVNDSTIINNQVGMDGGGIYVLNYGDNVIHAVITNTIISGNIVSDTLTANDLELSAPYGGEITNTFSSGGYSLIGTIGISITAFIDGVNGDIVGVNDPKLFPLANNGGSTLTHALQPDSPALDAGGNCGATDQRGIPRPQGAVCDIGAYEYEVAIIYTDFVFLPVVVK